MKKATIILGIALLVAATVSIASRPVPVDHKLISIQARDSLPGFDAIEDEPIEVQAAIVDLGDDMRLRLKAQAALMAYPEMARVVFPLYASEPEFQHILRTYGEHVLPPIYFFIQNSVASIELMDKASKSYQRAKIYVTKLTGDVIDEPGEPGESEKITPEERGWYAVNFIDSEGHDFLGQFVVDTYGQARWVQTERAMEGLTQFFTSGIRRLETNIRSDEALSVGDFGWAAVDVLVFASAVKVLRAGRTAARTTQGARVSTRSAALAARVGASGRMALKSARYAKWPLIIGAGYLVVAHPSVINDFLASVAEVVGMPAWTLQVVGWLLILMPLLYIASWLLWPLTAVLQGLLFILYRLRGGRPSHSIAG